MGAVVLVDAISNNTVAAGMISHARPDEAAERRKRQGVVSFQVTRVTPLERQHRHGHRAAVILSNDKVLAEALDRAFFDRGWQSILIEGSHPSLDVPPAWLLGALEAANLVVVFDPQAAAAGAPNSTVGDYPVVSVSLVGDIESSVRRATESLADLRVIPADDQAGYGEGI
jgi:hypothetical protein